MRALTSNGFISTIIPMKYCIECNAPKSYKGEYCKVCSYKHRTRPSGLKYNIRMVNKGWIKKGQLLRIGFKVSKETRHKLSIAAKGQHRSPATEFRDGANSTVKNSNWKGDEVGYHALHTWVSRHKVKVGICEYCNAKGRTVWANMDFQYTRNLTTWGELCQKCHSKYDRKNGWGIASKKFKELRHG